MVSKNLHHDEMISNIFLFKTAGYETTSMALGSCTYILATKNDIQDKFQAEIEEQEWNDENQLNYDLVMNMTYMDLFIREVLPIYPIEKGYFFSRKIFFNSFFRQYHSTGCSSRSLRS